MSLNEEFDELARRKLEERAFPFQEADWQDAHARIDAQRDGRGRAAWILSAGLLLLMGGALWLGTRPAATESPIAAVVSEGVTAPNVGITSIPKERDASSEPIGKTNDAAVPGASRRAEPAEVVEKRTVPSEASSVAATASVKTITSRSATSSPAVPATQPRSAKSEPGERDQDQAQEKIVMMVANIPATVLADDAVTSETPETTHADPQGSIEGKGASTEPGIPTTPAEVRADNGPGSLKTTTVSSDQGQRTINEDVAAQRTTTAVTGQEDAAKDAVLQGPKDVPSIAVSNESSDRVTTGEGFANEQPLNAPPLNSDSNSTATAKMLAPSDSAAPIAPTLPAPLPLVPERAPWEISAMGGVFNSKSHYSGGNSADWTGSVSGARSVGAGVELMHMGRNIGIGTGLHYGSYAERISTDAINMSTTTFNQYWYLIAVDTMVLFITDTLPGQPPSYTGTSIDTTIHVLAQGTDSTTSSQHLREARDQVNRVSYLEVPILLDAHVVQGRWSLGLRGGPTIGLLTGRRGSLPNTTDDGYLGFNDVAFREVVFGYSGRAYIRYRFNAGWSVGLEPAMRGQLLNSFGSGELERRASAFGVMMSLTYRLR